MGRGGDGTRVLAETVLNKRNWTMQKYIGGNCFERALPWNKKNLAWEPALHRPFWCLWKILLAEHAWNFLHWTMHLYAAGGIHLELALLGAAKIDVRGPGPA